MDDWDSDSDDSDDADDSDSSSNKKAKKKDKKLNPKKATLGQSKKMKEEKKHSDFFGDL
jgi:hypothetical protein